MSDLPRFLDGPKFAAWLLIEGVRKTDLTESEQRRFYGWEHGARADVISDVCDKLLTRYLLMNLIPDSCWHPTQTRYLKPDNRAHHAIDLINAGMTVNQVAKEMSLHPRTINRYLRQLTPSPLTPR